MSSASSASIIANSPNGYGENIMLKKDKSACDQFTLALTGMRTIASFAPMPVLAYDRLRKDLSARAGSTSGTHGRWGLRRLRAV